MKMNEAIRGISVSFEVSSNKKYRDVTVEDRMTGRQR